MEQNYRKIGSRLKDSAAYFFCALPFESRRVLGSRGCAGLGRNFRSSGTAMSFGLSRQGMYGETIELECRNVRRQNMKKEFILRFIREDGGQDLVEYTLLLAFVCLASAALFINAGTSISGIWTQANIRLANANDASASTS